MSPPIPAADPANSPASRLVPQWLGRLWREHPLAVLAGIVILSVAGIIVLIWPVTDLIAAHDVGLIAGPKRAPALQSAREAVRTQLLTLGAGIFAAGTLVYTARSFSLSRGTLEATRRTVQVSEQGQVTDRYAKAIEQLGSGPLDVRIGAIYSLERIARDSPRDHPAIMDVLSVFVREHSGEPWPDPQSAEGKLGVRLTRPDIQAAVTVIGRRDFTRDVHPIDLSGSDLRYADLTAARLQGARLSRMFAEYARLEDADLRGADLGQVSFTNARLDRANLSGADMYDDASLDGAVLTRTNLSHVKFNGVNIRTDFSSAVLAGAEFSHVNLAGATFPADVPVPAGWVRDPESGRMRPADPADPFPAGSDSS